MKKLFVFSVTLLIVLFVSAQNSNVHHFKITKNIPTEVVGITVGGYKMEEQARKQGFKLNESLNNIYIDSKTRAKCYQKPNGELFEDNYFSLMWLSLMITNNRQLILYFPSTKEKVDMMRIFILGAVEKKFLSEEDRNSVGIYEKECTYNFEDKNGNTLKVCFKEEETKLIFTNNNTNNIKKNIVYEYVDLGLPSGTLWATCNVGASKPEDYGDYFAWGETSGYNSGKRNFAWSTYKYSNGSSSSMTKYCTSSSNGTVDNKTILVVSDDAATANWGSSWRMPTIEECEELINSNYTTTKRTIINGVEGRKITSKKNGNSIFLPAAGCRVDSDLYFAGSNGCYWSSSLGSSYSIFGRELGYDSIGIDAGDGARNHGYSVRPVRSSDSQIISESILGDFFNDLLLSQ